MESIVNFLTAWFDLPHCRMEIKRLERLREYHIREAGKINVRLHRLREQAR